MCLFIRGLQIQGFAGFLGGRLQILERIRVLQNHCNGHKSDCFDRAVLL